MPELQGQRSGWLSSKPAGLPIVRRKRNLLSAWNCNVLWNYSMLGNYNVLVRGMEKPIEVNCLGVPKGKYKITDKKMVFSWHYPAKPESFKEYRVVMIYNEKLGTWEPKPLIEYIDSCPICGKLMLVRAIAGTTWLACCSEKCYEEWDRRNKKEAK
jgi:hypothetical protein